MPSSACKKKKHNANALIDVSIMSLCVMSFIFFFFNDTATTEIYTLSLHDALPISQGAGTPRRKSRRRAQRRRRARPGDARGGDRGAPGEHPGSRRARREREIGRAHV